MLINFRNASSYRIACQEFSENLIHGKNIDSDPASNNYSRHIFPKRQDTCPYCQALMWTDEKKGTSLKKPIFSLCCQKNQILLPSPIKPPESLLDLLFNRSELSNNFRDNIRYYNSILSFTSCKTQLDENLIKNQKGVYTYRINGTIHHSIGKYFTETINNFDGSPSVTPKFAQIYIYDAQFDTNSRIKLFKNINSELLNSLQQILQEHNPYVQIFKQAGLNLKNDPELDFRIKIKSNQQIQDRRYSLPSSDEIAVLMFTNSCENNTQKVNRDIVIYSKENDINDTNNTNKSKLTRINETQCYYDPLHYVTMFINGQPGWQAQNIPRNFQSKKSSFVSAMEFYSYQLQDRPSKYLRN